MSAYLSSTLPSSLLVHYFFLDEEILSGEPQTPGLCLRSLVMCLNCENEKGAGGGGGVVGKVGKKA